MKNLNVTFDSNIWFKIASPEFFKKDKNINSIVSIRDAILNRRIIAYLSETIFTLEPIKRIERKEKITTKPQNQIIEKITKQEVSTSFVLGPNLNHPGNNPIIDSFFQEAIKIGFRIVRLPRMGGFINPDIENYRYNLDGKDWQNFYNKATEVSGKIDERGAGFSQILSIGKKYDSNWIKGIKKAPIGESDKIASAVSEWADGDSVALSIGLNCDFFCTRDFAKKAGNKSVFSRENLDWLKNDYNFTTILPEDLIKKI